MGKYIEIIGNTYGRLTPLSENLDKWEDQISRGVKNKLHYYDCICECGKATTVQKQALLSGHIQSCGCIRLNNPKTTKDLSGLKYGRLTVIKRDLERDGKATKKTVPHWICNCSCGKTGISVSSYQLTSNKTKSCGCYASELTKLRNKQNCIKTNPVSFEGEIARVYNDSQTDSFIIDKEDYEYIKQWFWSKDVKGYWNANSRDGDSKSKSILRVHQEVAILKYGDYDSSKLVPDHLSRDKSDNTRNNLILKTYADNAKNRGLSKTNKTGKTGVYKRGNKYISYITVNYKTKQLGSYNTLEEAVQVRKAAEIQYGFTCDDVTASTT